MIEIWISIIALVLSVLSIVLASMKEGIGLALGFRESEATSAKRKNIKESLEKEVEKEISSFLEENRNKKDIDSQMKESILQIARNEYYLTLGDDLLEEMTRVMTRFLRQLVSALGMTFVTVFYFMLYMSLGIIFETIYFVFGVVYAVFAVYICYKTVTSAKSYFHLRLAFQRLAENPTCDTCRRLDDWLETKGISI